MRSLAFPSLLAIAACSDDAALTNLSEPTAIAPPAAELVASTSPEPEGPVEAGSRDTASAGGAADLLRRYYGLIAERRYAEAWRLREPSARGLDAARLEESYSGHSELSASVGTPSEPSAVGEWLYVEVPVQTYGRMKDGRPFSSAGTVTLRRPAGGGGDWRIFGG